MCRDELILKQAALGVLSLDTAAGDAAALLACYEGAPVGRSRAPAAPFLPTQLLCTPALLTR